MVEGSSITGASIDNSIIGIRGRVDEGTHLKDVIFMGSDFYDGEQRLDDAEQQGSDVPRMGIGKNCKLERCIIDKNVRIGDNVIIEAQPDVEEYQGQRRWIRDGITIIPKGTVIKAGTVFKAGDNN